MEVMIMDEKDKKIEELEAQLKKIEEAKKEDERRRYISNKFGNFSFIIAWNIFYLWIIFTLKDIFLSWFYEGSGTDYEKMFVFFTWAVIAAYAIYRLIAELVELFRPEIIFSVKWIGNWIDETQKARVLYLENKKKKQEL